MSIPGYDSSDIAEYTLEHAGARVDVVAGVVPDEFGLEKSGREPPVDALADPVELTGLGGLTAVEAIRIALVYDPSKLPPGASPTDVAVAVDSDDEGWEPVESTVDLEETTVTTVLNDKPASSTVVAGYDDRSDDTTGVA
ncbi:hypothetical protein GS429_12305 [Natronorubrum sp. JWXQ-INN-674]|uniref:Uncharacterized protein n=1 Tax=Natronorubrum halalkaliphilum TaxID=2691917 RepID=A0A6B0VMR5_9EURY|nr:hypothetical protein [Natronorubrum halalkaliphilum]MXV62834.1 hypothetical protein [Natronorubrum halalkaliphilum]